MSKFKHQPPFLYKGKRVKRVPAGTCVTPLIWDEVDRVARKFQVSRSWVIAVALAETFGIEVDNFTKLEGKRNAQVRNS